MPPVRGQEEEDCDSGDDTSFSFPSVAAAREGANSEKGGGGDAGYIGWARRVMATASEGRFGRTLRIGPWAKKAPREGSQTKGGSSGLWPRWDASRPPLPAASGQQQKMARYRQEMLELVHDAPESAYELSLRDLAQLPRPADGGTAESAAVRNEGQMGTEGEGRQDTAGVDEEAEKKIRRKKGNTGKETWRFWRSRKEGTGALVWNMAFSPVVIGLSGWRRITERTTTTAKTSQKAMVHDVNSGSGSPSRSRRKQAGCYAWL